MRRRNHKFLKVKMGYGDRETTMLINKKHIVHIEADMGSTHIKLINDESLLTLTSLEECANQLEEYLK